MATAFANRRLWSTFWSIRRRCSVNIQRNSTRSFTGSRVTTAPLLFTTFNERRLSTTVNRRKDAVIGQKGVIHTPDSKVQVSRVLSPDDANPMGYIHGGIVLKMIAEAGYICATKYCNSEESRLLGNEECSAALVRAERTDFIQSMFVGEFAKVDAEVTYTSKHSLEVQVSVFAENVMEGTQRLTNKAQLWFVPISFDDPPIQVMKVPPMVYSSPEEEAQGKLRYEKQKAQRMNETDKHFVESVDFHNFAYETEEPYTVPFSQSSLSHMVVSSDCTLHGYVRGGAIMKLMDEVAGLVAIKHAMAPAVTASIEAINFHKQIQQASVINLLGRITYSSEKTMEVQVLVDVQYLSLSHRQIFKQRACDAYFTFVSLSPDDFMPQKVPPIKLLNEEETERFKRGHERYKAKKALREQERKKTS